MGGVAEREERRLPGFPHPRPPVARPSSATRLVQFDEDIARRVEAFGRLQPPAILDQRRGPLLAEMVELRAVLATDDEDVGKTCSREQRRLGAAPLQQRVGGDRHAVDHVGLMHVQRIEAGDDGAALIHRRGRDLMHGQAAVRQNHKVSERTADVDADQGPVRAR